MFLWLVDPVNPIPRRNSKPYFRLSNVFDVPELFIHLEQSTSLSLKRLSTGVCLMHDPGSTDVVRDGGNHGYSSD